jgi:predicted metal-binding membrane protein
MPAYSDPRRPPTIAALVATLAVAALCWGVAIRRMQGMDMGVDTSLGSLAFFTAAWVPMMAAMMLPGVAPAVVRRAGNTGHAASGLVLAGGYLAVWAAAGGAVYALYRPHGTLAAGLVTVAAGLYELTPLKLRLRLRCQARIRSGLRLGLCCLGSSAGLMAMFLALGAMSVTWMVVVAAIVVAQKLLRPALAVDVPVALAIVALGVVVAADPSAVPGLTPPMSSM